MAIIGRLKQSTAATVVLGPFVDKTDGVTAKTALTLTARLAKNGGAFGARSSATALAHLTGTGNEGYYSCTLDTTDTNTLGRLTIVVNDPTNALPVRQDYEVLRADEFDALFTATGSAMRGILAYGTAQAATSTTVQLAAAETFADNTLNGASVAVFGSTQGYWQTRSITGYVSSTDTATVDTWTVTPSGTLTYIVFAGAPASTTSLAPVNVKQINDVTVLGAGTSGNKWRA